MVPHDVDKSPSPSSEVAFITERIVHWDKNALNSNRNGESLRDYYRGRLIELYKFLIPEGASVLELGCGKGDLLAALNPSYGVGVDFSSQMIGAARHAHPNLHFFEMDVQYLQVSGTFDYIIASDLLNELWDVQTVLASLRHLCHPQTRLILNLHSNLWQAPRRIGTKIGIARPQLIQNWISPEDTANLLYLTDFEIIRTSSEVLWPLRTPFIDTFCNCFLVKFWPFSFFGLTNLIIARPKPQRRPLDALVSVIVPARDEAGNISVLFDRIPTMGLGTEIIFVEGGSQDDTYGVIKNEIEKRQRPLTKLLRQTGQGKADAVRLGFAHATGEVLMILDADLTVAPEDLPRFYDAWLAGKGDFINGIRMVYPMEERAMQFLNLVGNQFFSAAFSFLLGQKVKDTACGTKVLSKSNYEAILKNRGYFGDFDQFGDWDLLFGAAKLNLKIVDLPIRYRERGYGVSKMQRWHVGALLLRMVIVGLKRLKFV